MSDLRYSLQAARGWRYRVVKSYDADDEDYRVIQMVLVKLARQHPRIKFRIVEMPWNVLADTPHTAAIALGHLGQTDGKN